MRQYSDL